MEKVFQMNKNLIIALSVMLALVIGIFFAIKYLPLWATLLCLACFIAGGVCGFFGLKYFNNRKTLLGKQD